MAVDPNAGWTLGSVGVPSQSTMPTPAQVEQIHAMTSMMQQQPSAVTPQQQTMMSGMFGPQSNLGQNIGAMGQGIIGGPAYGGGNIFTGDAYGGSAQNPLPGLTAQDYG